MHAPQAFMRSGTAMRQACGFSTRSRYVAWTKLSTRVVRWTFEDVAMITSKNRVGRCGVSVSAAAALLLGIGMNARASVLDYLSEPTPQWAMPQWGASQWATSQW